MTNKNFVGLLFMFFLWSCSNNKSTDTHKSFSGRVCNDSIQGLGIHICTEPIRGSIYGDSTGTKYAYRYVRAFVVNDTTIPIQIKITFPEEYYYSDTEYTTGQKLKFKVFILPDTLTEEAMRGLSQVATTVDKNGWHRETGALEKFLDGGLKTPVILNKIINPKEECPVNIGLLIDINYCQPGVVLFSKGLKHHSLSVPDNLINQNPSFEDQRTLLLRVNFCGCQSIISCGQISFSN